MAVPTVPPTLASLPTSEESEDLLRIRHSCAHIMAMAVQRLHKGAQVTIGPWTDRGFFYDFDMPQPLTERDLPKIRKEMQRILKKNLPFVREDAAGEPYKLEILDSILERDPQAPITIYHIGTPGSEDHWWDLCAGPHVAATGDILPDALDLESVAGAYWRGDETRPMLQRIYGTAWQTKEQLIAYHRFNEEAALRDHRRLGQELDLFSINEACGGGLVFWHPKGAMVRHLVEDFWKSIHLQYGYHLLFTPHIAKVDLWKTSGHFDFYRDSMFNQMDLKPMNCPFHITIYKQGYYSYRDLPIKWAELGTVYRYERSGTMHGLFRDDAHIFCLPTQIEAEILGVLDLTELLLSQFGFHDFEASCKRKPPPRPCLQVNLSTRPDKFVGSPEIWDQAEHALKAALQRKGWAFAEDVGGGAFYGPKIDIKICDAIGRKWQCSTVQLDFNLPERFDMFYISDANIKERPIMIHRAILGSLERFMGILIENYAGAFPLWLAPVQCRLVPVNDAVMGYVSGVAQALQAAGLRVEVSSGLSVGKAIRAAEKDKIPVMCVVGQREASAGTVAVRTYSHGDVGCMLVEDLVERMAKASANKQPFS
ncbi:hypothetical protein CHLNCDRAFT_56367 [Chlorella variabilis]|uniref:threonine--tRNA ligase n=1 Tax=Chlorella variabilis TaxID=554065 RepID=E1ZQV4_CHLVA|nr:hypothetical protein CHLNCDRAFT_56367 [Chlorella variabilis]EFN51790.1 hypothetical protein CHLNCDRAFT_56367 [Chlorella variabilis]|eukprot:XP_005843892.1 hypothetical protein CHLNCDRAFT_56367 [Chlorella variabilis]